MTDSRSNALVPVRVSVPARRAVTGAAGYGASDPGRDGKPHAFDLVSEVTTLEDHAQIQRYLPDILGRALARAWIDAGFRTAFCANPKATLAAHRIRLPESVIISVITEGQTRPMVVVSEAGLGDRPARRLLYLQLVMVAGK